MNNKCEHQIWQQAISCDSMEPEEIEFETALYDALYLTLRDENFNVKDFGLAELPEHVSSLY